MVDLFAGPVHAYIGGEQTNPARYSVCFCRAVANQIIEPTGSLENAVATRIHGDRHYYFPPGFR